MHLDNYVQHNSIHVKKLEVLHVGKLNCQTNFNIIAQLYYKLYLQVQFLAKTGQIVVFTKCL